MVDAEILLKKCSKEQAVKECEGYKWFGIETELVPEGILIPEFKGKTFPQYNGIDGNEEWIRKLIEFYKVKFKPTDKVAIHGDMALCNVIFGKEIYLIDWEHFHFNKPEFFGFDIINMLFIHLQYQYRWRSYWGFNWIPFIKTSHRKFIKECIQRLGNVGMARTPFRNGRLYIQRYMDKNKFILGKQSDEAIDSLDWLVI